MAKKTTTPETTLDPAKVLEQVRETAEQNLAAVKDNFAKSQNVLTTLQAEAEDGVAVVQDQTSKISMALIDVVRKNTEASLMHAEKLVGVTSIAQLIELQTGFLRQQAENTLETTKNLQTLYQDAGTQMVGDAKDAAEKAMSELRKLT
ncbi:MAG: phasin family protein [Pseudomonadota bacterium]